MLRFYNTLTRREEQFVPLVPGQVGMYVCGPTVYAAPHIGNMRTFFFSDVVRRYLEFRGYQVKFVMNLTDVDDKTIRGAMRDGVSLGEYVRPYIDDLFRDFERLGIRRADAHPRATDHIGGMVDIIRRLEEKGLAYEAEGSVYFDISEFPDYGKLSKVDVSAGRRGERVAADEYDKDDVRDFVLWKAVKREDEQVGAVWDTPWGRGRPGWHIECSAMSFAELGETFDIHAGGVDLVFPHHEDEIAQSEGATGKPFVRYWLHGEFLLLEGDKMAKSTGNIFNLQDLIDRGVKPSSVRYLFLTAHYRSKLNFTFDGLSAAAEAVKRIRGARNRLREQPAARDPDPSDTPVLHELVDDVLGRFTAAMDEDLNTSKALSELFRLVDGVNSRLQELVGRSISEAEQQAALAAFDRIDTVFGFLGLADEESSVDADLGAWVEERLAARQAARQAKDFAASDAIRAELLERGIVVEDTPQGQRWQRLG